MKLVIGIVRPEKANDVLEALYRAEVRGVSISRVQGHGGELDRVETYRGTTVKMGLADKVRFEIAVSDSFVDTDDRGAPRGRADRRGRRRQDLRGPARARRAHPHRRERRGRRDPGGCLMTLSLIAQAAEIDTGDTAWMLAATALVLMMTPALGLFYAGLVRAKNTLNTFMMCVAAIAIATVTWAAVGYSLAFDGTGDLIGGLDYAFLNDVTLEPRNVIGTATRRRSRTSSSSPSRRPSASSPIALISGAVVERMRFSAFLVFAALWSVLVYAVLAHWAFGGGWMFERGTLDFAGGVPVEMASGFSALAAALVVGARKDYGRQALLPHNAVYVLVGAGLLWFGWFGFNGGSGFGANAASSARLRQHAADARPAPWSPGSRSTRSRGRKVTAIGAATAIIVGCVLITPAGGLHQPGLGHGPGRAWRDPLLAAGRLSPAHAGRRDARRARRPRARGLHRESSSSASFAQVGWNGLSDGLFYGNGDSSSISSWPPLATPVYAFVATFILLKVVGALMPLRASEREEAIGMDVVYHGEEAYPTGEGAILVEPDVEGETPAMAKAGSPRRGHWLELSLPGSPTSLSRAAPPGGQSMPRPPRDPVPAAAPVDAIGAGDADDHICPPGSSDPAADLAA